MQVKDVVKDFGELVGIQSLEINENGVLHVTIHNIGDLFIDEKYSFESGDHVFVYLLRVYEHVDGMLYGRALKLCDYERGRKFTINPVLHGDNALGFAIKWPIDSFNINILREMIDVLKTLQDRLEGGI